VALRYALARIGAIPSFAGGLSEAAKDLFLAAATISMGRPTLRFPHVASCDVVADFIVACVVAH
jgi:hypothetical protein